jgi:hypothetical protein
MTKPNNIDRLDSLVLNFADQISTLITKLHHKELDFDEANTLSNNYQTRFKAAIQNLMVQERLEAVDKIFELSPKQTFEHWKPTDALQFYERLKDYEEQLSPNLNRTRRIMNNHKHKWHKETDWRGASCECGAKTWTVYKGIDSNGILITGEKIIGEAELTPKEN